MAMYCKGRLWRPCAHGWKYAGLPRLWPWLLAAGAWALPGLLLAGSLGIAEGNVLLWIVCQSRGMLLCLMGMGCALIGIASARRHLHGGVLALCLLALPLNAYVCLLSAVECTW